MKDLSHFTIAAEENGSRYLVIHLESGQQYSIDRQELLHLYECCSHWVKERESQ